MTTGQRRPMPTVLIADDDATVRAIATRALSRAGYVIIEARDGSEALDLATRHLPDVAVLDWLMPGVQGPDVCARLRAQPGTDGTGVLLLTSRSSEEEVRLAFEHGADDFLTKPFDAQELVALVAHLAEVRAARASTADEGPRRETDQEGQDRLASLFARLRSQLAELETNGDPSALDPPVDRG